MTAADVTVCAAAWAAFFVTVPLVRAAVVRLRRRAAVRRTARMRSMSDDQLGRNPAVRVAEALVYRAWVTSEQHNS